MDLIGKSVSYLHDNLKLCVEHFEPSQYHAGTGRLKRNAVPTRFAVPEAESPNNDTTMEPKSGQEPPSKKPKIGKLHGNSTQPETYIEAYRSIQRCVL